VIFFDPAEETRIAVVGLVVNAASVAQKKREPIDDMIDAHAWMRCQARNMASGRRSVKRAYSMMVGLASY